MCKTCFFPILFSDEVVNNLEVFRYVYEKANIGFLSGNLTSFAQEAILNEIYGQVISTQTLVNSRQ